MDVIVDNITALQNQVTELLDENFSFSKDSLNENDFNSKSNENIEESSKLLENWKEFKDEKNQPYFTNENGIVVYDRNIACGELPEEGEFSLLLETLKDSVLIKNDDVDVQSLQEIENYEVAIIHDESEDEDIDSEKSENISEDIIVNDKAILTRMILSCKKREKVLLKHAKKEEDKQGFFKSVKQKLSDVCEYVVPSTESTILEYVDENEVIDNISIQLDSVCEELKNRRINPENAKETMKRKIHEISNQYITEIQKLKEQVSKELMQNELDVNFDKIIELSKQSKILQENRKSELKKLKEPEKWLIEVYNEEKVKYFKECIQAYLEEQLVTYKALALGTVSRKTDNIEKIAKITHVGTKIGIQITELAAVGMVPGIGALGFVSTAMSIGRGLMKFYKDREVLLQAKNILNHCGRRIKDIVEFAEEFSDIISNSYKNQIVHFTFSSIALLSQLVVEQRIPWMIHLEHIPQRSKIDTVQLLTSVIIPKEYIKSLSLFDSIVCSLTLKTEEGKELNAWRLLRKSSFKSRIPLNIGDNVNSNWVFALPIKEQDQKISIQLESICIDSFREIPYVEFIKLFNPDNKVKYCKYDENQVTEWKKSFNFIEQDDTSKYHSKLPQQILNTLYMSPEYRNKSRTSPNAPPSSGTSLLDIADDCYGQYIQMEAMYNCFNTVTEKSGDTDADILAILECLGTIIPDRGISKFAVSSIISELSDWFLG